MLQSSGQDYPGHVNFQSPVKDIPDLYLNLPFPFETTFLDLLLSQVKQAYWQDFIQLFNE